MATFRNPKPATADKVSSVGPDLESGNYSGPSNVAVKTPPFRSSTPPAAPEGSSPWWKIPGLYGTATETKAGRKSRKVRKTRKGGKRIRKTHRRRR
jgi:hypothetical protein